MTLEDRAMHWANHTTGLPGASEMQFSQLLNACQRRWRLIALIAGLGTAVIASILFIVLPRYTATALVIDRSMQSDDIEAAAQARARLILLSILRSRC